MTNLEHEIQAIAEQYQLGNISQQERDSLLTEIKDIRIAYEYANHEETARYLVRACNIAMGIL